MNHYQLQISDTAKTYAQGSAIILMTFRFQSKHVAQKYWQ